MGVLDRGPHTDAHSARTSSEQSVPTPGVLEAANGYDGSGEQPTETDADEAPAEKASGAAEKYSVFTHREKTMIVFAGSMAQFFSPLSSSIYFPVLSTIADELNVTITQINLTITTFLIMQGIAPMMIAGFSDRMGRRPAYIICFTIYMAANLGLALQDSYGALLGLRLLQSAGGSVTVTLAHGLVGDLVTSEERGRYIAIASIGSLLGPSVSPVLGGVISQSAGWHWIFWFLLIFAGTFCVPLFLFLPETCRNIVADGSIPPPPLNWSLTDAIRFERRRRRGIEIDVARQEELRKNYKFRFPNPMPTLRIIVDLESAVILFATGLVLICFYAISTGASSSFRSVYGFNDIQIALMFLPIAGGALLSTFTTGKLIDWNYRRHARMRGITIVKGVRQDLSEFPIERARMEVGIPTGVVGAVFVIAYGWTMDHKTSLAAPVVFLFMIGYGLMAAHQVMNVLIVDIWPGQSAAASAANNFIRCELGAAACAAIEPMSAAMGRGWAYTTMAAIYLAFTPAMGLAMSRGIEWRRVRREREEQQATMRPK